MIFEICSMKNFKPVYYIVTSTRWIFNQILANSRIQSCRGRRLVDSTLPCLILDGTFWFLQICKCKAVHPTDI